MSNRCVLVSIQLHANPLFGRTLLFWCLCNEFCFLCGNIDGYHGLGGRYMVSVHGLDISATFFLMKFHVCLYGPIWSSYHGYYVGYPPKVGSYHGCQRSIRTSLAIHMAPVAETHASAIYFGEYTWWLSPSAIYYSRLIENFPKCFRNLFDR